MRLSLRVRVLLLVFLVNAVLFAAGGWFLLGIQERENGRIERARADDLLYTLKKSIRPDQDVHAAEILEWPSWPLFEDAMLVDAQVTRSTTGVVELSGLAINPLGRVGRDAEFDEEAVYSGLFAAIRNKVEVRGVAGGRAVPIVGPTGLWGAVWTKSRGVDRTGLALTLLGWFIGATLLMTAGTFTILRRLVLDPVGELALGARRVREGDLTVRIAEPGRRDEVSDLVRSFNAMTIEVSDFNARLANEVEIATAQARHAEQAAMTQRRLAAMGELAAGIAHEINNPLGGLQNAVERLRSGGLPEAKEQEYLGLLERGLERIGQTVRQLLRFTPRNLEHGPVDLCDVAQDAADLVRHRADRSGVALTLDITDAGGVVTGARNELGQAVLNLLVNALDALDEKGTEDPAGPRIFLEVEGGDEAVVLRVRDNGPGVPEEELGKVADLFYSTKEVGKGSGLGLALVHNTIASHGGEVELMCEDGKGLTVEIRLPPVEPVP